MWMRNFVKNHPLYANDSIVNEQIQYDLFWSIKQMADEDQNNRFQITNDRTVYQMKY